MFRLLAKAKNRTKDFHVAESKSVMVSRGHYGKSGALNNNRSAASAAE